MVNSVSVPYGYNVIRVGSVNVFTAKLRVKEDYNTAWTHLCKDMADPISVYSGKKEGTLIITWTTIDQHQHSKCISKMNDLLAEIMHARIDAKYFPEVAARQQADMMPNLSF